MFETEDMINETKILDELKAIVSPFSAYLDNLYLAFTTSSNQYWRQVEEGKVNPVLAAFYGPKWGDCTWVFDRSTGIRRTVTTLILDVEDADLPHPEYNIVEESFDDWVIKALEKEKRRILASILELVNNSQSPHSTWTKLNFLTDEVHDLKSQFIIGNSFYFTERVVTQAKKILNEIDKNLIKNIPQAAEPKPKSVNTFEYQGEDIEQLYDLYDRLQTDNRFIDGRQSRPSSFVNGFRGRITMPVVWSGTNDELRYFIVEIIALKTAATDSYLIKTSRKHHWGVVNQLFIDKSGNRFLDTLKNNNDVNANSKRAIDSILAQFR
jgi:hypothetical protein